MANPFMLGLDKGLRDEIISLVEEINRNEALMSENIEVDDDDTQDMPTVRDLIKASPPPPPVAKTCQCAFFSKYTGLKKDCDSCRGKSTTQKRMAFYDTLCQAAMALDAAGYTGLCEDLRTYAASISLWFVG